ncbi:unnamed protein product, partial [Symbiodinium pilosum]
FCDAICDLGFAGAQCRADCDSNARKITRTFCRCGLCSEYHLLQETEDVGLLHFRAHAMTEVQQNNEASSEESSEKICDDGLRCKGDRELSCIKGCMAKFSDVKNILETYEESCPDCKVRGPKDDDGKKRDDDGKKKDDDGKKKDDDGKRKDDDKKDDDKRNK